ncbi:Hypothetical protein NTJ_02573 [Nesidiocoris tenuis]|nr:Hypothetical protein NTJ_02573 [Nesidiocoris tenuis]
MPGLPEKGHFSRVCRSGKVHEVIASGLTDYPTPSNNRIGFIGNISSSLTENDPWCIEVLVNDEDRTTFKMDSGADVSLWPADIKLKKKNCLYCLLDKYSPDPMVNHYLE